MKIIKKISAAALALISAFLCSFLNFENEKPGDKGARSAEQKIIAEKPDNKEELGGINVIFLKAAADSDKIYFYSPKELKSGNKSEFGKDEEEYPVSFSFEIFSDGEAVPSGEIPGPGEIAVKCRITEKEKTAKPSVLAFAMIIGGDCEEMKAENAKIFNIGGKSGAAGYFAAFLKENQKSEFELSGNLKGESADISFVALCVSGEFDDIKKLSKEKINRLNSEINNALNKLSEIICNKSDEISKKADELYKFAEDAEKAGLKSAEDSAKIRADLESEFSSELSDAQKLLPEGEEYTLTKENYSKILKEINSKEAILSNSMLSKTEIAIKLAKANETGALKSAKTAGELKERIKEARDVSENEKADINAEALREILGIDEQLQKIIG